MVTSIITQTCSGTDIADTCLVKPQWEQKSLGREQLFPQMLSVLCLSENSVCKGNREHL